MCTTIQKLKPYQNVRTLLLKMQDVYSTQLTSMIYTGRHLEHVAGDDTERQKNNLHHHLIVLRISEDLRVSDLSRSIYCKYTCMDSQRMGPLFFCCGYRDVIPSVLGGFPECYFPFVNLEGNGGWPTQHYCIVGIF